MGINITTKSFLVFLQEILTNTKLKDLNVFVNDGDKAAISYTKFTFDSTLTLGNKLGDN